jgi:hypothetical protein
MSFYSFKLSLEVKRGRKLSIDKVKKFLSSVLALLFHYPYTRE